MAKYILYDIANETFHNEYESSDGPTQFGGDNGDESKNLNMLVPDGLDYRKHIIVEVVIPEGQTEDDIIFDHKSVRFDMMGTITKYFKFEFDSDKEAAVDAEDAAAALTAAKNTKKNKGHLFRQLSRDLYNIMKGHAYDNGLNASQISQLKTDNATVFALIKDEMPITAKPLIDALVVDGTLITQDFVDDLALEYTEFFAAHPEIPAP